jgi:hypothetical protein
MHLCGRAKARGHCRKVDCSANRWSGDPLVETLSHAA